MVAYRDIKNPKEGKYSATMEFITYVKKQKIHTCEKPKDVFKIQKSCRAKIKHLPAEEELNVVEPEALSRAKTFEQMFSGSHSRAENRLHPVLEWAF